MVIRVNDELPEQVRPSSFVSGLPQSPWDQGPTRLSSGVSKGGNTASPLAVVPGGEQYSHAELASYSNRPDRDYNGAGRATMPPGLNATGVGELVLPNKVSGTSWETSGGGGGEAHPSEVTQWVGAKPEKP